MKRKTARSKALRTYARRIPRKTMIRKLQKKIGKTAAEKMVDGMKKWAKK